MECMGCEKGRWSVVEIERMEFPRKRRPGRCRRQKSHFNSTHRGRLVARLSICIITPYSGYPFDWRKLDVAVRKRNGSVDGEAEIEVIRVLWWTEE